MTSIIAIIHKEVVSTETVKTIGVIIHATIWPIFTQKEIIVKYKMQNGPVIWDLVTS
jgi:hypothetical protein